MSKYFFAIFIGFLAIPETTLAFDFDSDTTSGSHTFSEALAFDGYFGREDSLTKKELDKTKRLTWAVDYTYSRQQVLNNIGIETYDNTTEIDFSVGSKRKKVSELAVGITYATTPDENLKDAGPNFFFGQTISLSSKTDEGFYPTLAYKFLISDLNYVQTFSTSTVTRTGKIKPVTGASSINQIYPSLTLTWEPMDPLTFKGQYTHYFYNRNVNDFLATLDSPRAVAVGIFGLTNVVSSFNTDMWEFDINWLPVENWEFDEEVTAATSAIDGSMTWTFKESALYDISKNWTLGLSYEYEQSNILIEDLYTLTIRYAGD